MLRIVQQQQHPMYAKALILSIPPPLQTLLIRVSVQKTHTWVDLHVGGDTVGIDNALEATGELVGAEVCGWLLFGLQLLHDAWHSAATYFLQWESTGDKASLVHHAVSTQKKGNRNTQKHTYENLFF